MRGSRAFLAAISLVALGAPAFAQGAESGSTASAAENESSARTLAGIAATVNDEMISIADVVERARLMLVTVGAQPSREILQQVMPSALDELINERLQLQNAKQYDLVVSDEDVTASIRDIAQQNQTTVDQLLGSLVAAGVNPETLRDQMRAEIAWRRTISGLYGSRIRVSPLQIDEYIRNLKESATKTRYQLAEIFLYAPTDDEKERMVQNANAILNQLKQGAQFQLAARQYSNSPSAATGGDLGVVSAGELEPEVQAILAELTPPTVTAPIVTQKGVYIYMVRGRQEGASGPAEVDLRQVFSPSGDRDALFNLAFEAPACDQLESVADNSGLVYTNLGQLTETDLTPQIQASIRGLQTGGVSEVYDTANGPAVLFVCDRTAAGLNIPTREQVEDRLYGQQLSLSSERKMRDLKREATIGRR